MIITCMEVLFNIPFVEPDLNSIFLQYVSIPNNNELDIGFKQQQPHNITCWDVLAISSHSDRFKP